MTTNWVISPLAGIGSPYLLMRGGTLAYNLSSRIGIRLGRSGDLTTSSATGLLAKAPYRMRPRVPRGHRPTGPTFSLIADPRQYNRWLNANSTNGTSSLGLESCHHFASREISLPTGSTGISGSMIHKTSQSCS